MLIYIAPVVLSADGCSKDAWHHIFIWWKLTGILNPIGKKGQTGNLHPGSRLAPNTMENIRLIVSGKGEGRH
eukprot:1252294-Ditylum_brightwellii.AAC.1